MRKRQIIVPVFFVGCIVLILALGLRHHHWLISGCLGMLFVFYCREYWKLVVRGTGGELFLRRQKKPFHWWTLALAVGATLFFLLFKIIPKWGLVLVWLIFLYEVFIIAVIHYKRPITLVLDGYQLKFRDVLITHRNISGLTNIEHDESKGSVLLSFKDQGRILIQKADYLEHELEDLLMLCQERSEAQISYATPLS